MSKKPVPSKKQCPSSTGSRTAKWRFELARSWSNKVQIMTCSECGSMRRMHFACAACGAYRASNSASAHNFK